jgi:hypothetical protein
MKKPIFKNLISEFLDAKTYVNSAYFNVSALVNFLNFVLNKKLLTVLCYMLVLSVLEFTFPFVFNEIFTSQDLISKSFGFSKIFSIVLVVSTFCLVSFLTNKHLNSFTYSLVTQKRKQIFADLFKAVDFHSYFAVSKILNIVDMLSLSIRKFVLNALQLISLFVVFVFLIATQYSSLIFLVLSVFAVNLALIMIGNLFAKRFINRNQTMRSILISEVFYGFKNQDLLQSKMRNSFLTRLQRLSDLDSEFRSARDTLIFSAKSFLAYIIVGFIMLIPLFEVYFVNIFAVLSLNFAAYFVFGIILSQMLYLSLEIGLFMPVTGIVSQLLFANKPHASTRDLANVSNIRFFSNYLKVKNIVTKNYECVLEKKEVNNISKNESLNKFILNFKNLKSLRNLFVQVDGKKMRFNNFCKYYKHQILYFSNNITPLYDLFSLDNDLDETLKSWSQYDILKPIFKSHLVFKQESYISPTKDFELGINFLRLIKSEPKMVIITKEDFKNSILKKDLLKLKKQNEFILVVC